MGEQILKISLRLDRSVLGPEISAPEPSDTQDSEKSAAEPSKMAASFKMLSRGLSTSSALNQLVKTPTQVFGTEGRYAAATKQKSLEAVEKDLKTMSDVIGKDARFAQFMADPSVKKNIKAEGVAGACDKMKMNALTKNLFVAMAENGRHGLVGPVIASFNTIMAAHRGEIICDVTTAKELNAAMKKEVEATIALFLKKGQKSLISYNVKPEIMGGMVVSIGDRFVDMSTASKVKKYTEIIQAAA